MSRSTGNQLSSSSRTPDLKGAFEPLQHMNLEGRIVEKGSARVDLGGSCDVFRAKLHTDEKIVDVAVKCIRVCLLDDPSFARDLEREVRLWSKLKHENVLPLLGFFLEGPKSIPNFVSAWMENGNLINYMNRRPIDVQEICTMLCGIASGLHYIHTEHRMVHADIKGSNILVSDEGRPLLAEFGISVSLLSSTFGATSSHGEKGSLRWMAKELHSGPFDGPAVKHTMMSDIWAFGMVISELLTRKKPFHSIGDWRVSKAIMDGQLPQEPDFQNLENDLTLRGLWSIGRECWHEDPPKRPTALEICDKVKHYKHTMTLETDRNSAATLPLRNFDPPKKNVLDSGLMLQRGSEVKKSTRRPLLSTNTSSRKVILQPLSRSIGPFQRPDVSIPQRFRSPIIGLKCFKNWVKSVLFNRFARPVLNERIGSGWGLLAGRVLDIGCGKGSDLRKWQKARIQEYVGLDVSEAVVKQAQSRYDRDVAEQRFPYFDAKLVSLDCFSHPLSEVLDPSLLDPLFDVVSMQFCLQVAFESHQKVRVALKNVSQWLRKGGIFVGTMPNDKILLSHLDDLPQSKLSFGNSVYQIQFEGRERRSDGGHRYWRSVHADETRDEEYVAQWDIFEQMASERDLELQYKAEFHEVYAEHCKHKDYGPLLRGMKVVDDNGECAMDEDQWDAANLYIAFAFKKV